MNRWFLAGFEHRGFGMIDGARFELEHFPENEDVVAGLKIFFHERQIPPPAMQPRRAVVENDFKNRPAAAAVTFQSLGDNNSAGGEGFAQRELGNFARVTAIFVTTRT